MDAMLGAIAFDTTTERTQRFTLDAIMNANNLAFFLEFFTGFYSQRPSVSNVCNREVSDCLDRLLAGTHNTSVRRRRAAERLEKAMSTYCQNVFFFWTKCDLFFVNQVSVLYL